MNNLCHNNDASDEKGMNHTTGKADKMKENGMKSLKDWWLKKYEKKFGWIRKNVYFCNVK